MAYHSGRKFKLTISLGKIEAATLEEARKTALALLEDYAGSNSGSEVLANATPILEQVDPPIAATKS